MSAPRRVIDLDEDDLAALIDARLAKALASMPSPPPPTSDAQPLSAKAVDKHYRLRSGTAARAVRSGALPACRRRGKGGIQNWIEPRAALAWFQSGCPATPPHE